MKSGMDQQFVNAGVCAARFTASAFPDSPIPGIASGMLATGSVTGSPQEAAEMLYSALARKHERGGRRNAARDAAHSWLARRGYVPGFGHPIHKRAEPRAQVLRRLALHAGGWGEAGAMLDAIGAELARVKRRRLPLNLAGGIAAVLVDVGWHPLEIGALGALGYGPALLAHVVEEIREGVPLRIIPEALGASYAGPSERHLPAQFRRRSGVGQLEPGEAGCRSTQSSRCAYGRVPS